MALIAPGIHQPFGLGLLAHQMAVLVVALLQPEVACLDRYGAKRLLCCQSSPWNGADSTGNPPAIWTAAPSTPNGCAGGSAPST